jgi:hypothetical protein
MRDCIFFVADKNMQFAFEGFLTKEKFYKSLGCGPFEFDPHLDLRVAATHDPAGQLGVLNHRKMPGLAVTGAGSLQSRGKDLLNITTADRPGDKIVPGRIMGGKIVICGLICFLGSKIVQNKQEHQ